MMSAASDEVATSAVATNSPMPKCRDLRCIDSSRRCFSVATYADSSAAAATLRSRRVRASYQVATALQRRALPVRSDSEAPGHCGGAEQDAMQRHHRDRRDDPSGDGDRVVPRAGCEKLGCMALHGGHEIDQ